MAKKKKPAPENQSHPPHRPEPEGGPFERQKAFVDERLRPLAPKRDDDEHPAEPDAEGGTHCGEEEDVET
jgi:hypothetical protein